MADDTAFTKPPRKPFSERLLAAIALQHRIILALFLRETRTPAGRGKPPIVKRVCSVYAVRPLQCRTWPFWDGVLASRQNWESAGKRCHGIDAGSRSFTRKQVESLRDATDWPKNPPTSKK